MTAPALRVYANGPNQVSGDNLNTFMQCAQTAAQLRLLTGVTGLAVLLLGIAGVNDGLGGVFYWSGSTAGTDDNLNTLVPYGTTPGAWLRVNLKVTNP